jgi:hypothetical protein
VLLSEERQRRKAASQRGRASTRVTGGLSGNPTLSNAALWQV